MPPKVKAAAAKPAAKGAAKAGAKAASPAPSPEPAPAAAAGREPLTVADAEARFSAVPEEDWDELRAVDDAPQPIAKTFEATLRLMGDPRADSWEVAKEAIVDPAALLRELRSLGPWGIAESYVEAATAALEAANIERLLQPDGPVPASPGAKSRAQAKASPAKAPAGAKAKAKAGAAPAAQPPPAGAKAALPVALLVEALLSVRRNERPPPFPMVWPTVPFSQVHAKLQQAKLSNQVACVVCPSRPASEAASAFLRCGGAVGCDVAALQRQMGLSKSLSREGARSAMGGCLLEAAQQGRRCVYLLGAAPPNVRHLCDTRQMPISAFDGEKLQETAEALGLTAAPAAGFHVVVLVQLSKARAEQVLPQLLPSFDEMAVIVVDPVTLPAPAAFSAALDQSLGGPRAALQLLALPMQEPPPAAPPADDGPAVNTEEFEYTEAFGQDWEERWSRGPATTDETGKAIRANLIRAELVRYPSNPRDAKPCLQLVGGAPNAPCTGIWTTFTPLARPTEIEFEFTLQGKVDMPNACLVFTEQPFDGSLPDTKVGVQFIVRGGMYLCGGGGGAGGGPVRISNDGKIQPDRWAKVLLKVDWNEKIVVGQVDTRGKGYAPAMQTVPFRDPTCEGFGCLYIYNTDVQGTTWISSLRISQGEIDMSGLDREGLEARAYLANRQRQREYDQAVAKDMEVGMVMGAIKSTKEHGMNLAQEQAANSSSAAGARM